MEAIAATIQPTTPVRFDEEPHGLDEILRPYARDSDTPLVIPCAIMEMRNGTVGYFRVNVTPVSREEYLAIMQDAQNVDERAKDRPSVPVYAGDLPPDHFIDERGAFILSE